MKMDEIEANGYNLNISRYVSTSLDEIKIDLNEVHTKMVAIDAKIAKATNEHNRY